MNKEMKLEDWCQAVRQIIAEHPEWVAALEKGGLWGTTHKGDLLERAHT